METETEKLTIPATDLRPGDGIAYTPEQGNGIAYRILKVWRATAGEAKLWKADGLQRGDVCARVRWADGGEGDRFWTPAHQVRNVVRDD